MVFRVHFRFHLSFFQKNFIFFKRKLWPVYNFLQHLMIQFMQTRLQLKQAMPNVWGMSLQLKQAMLNVWGMLLQLKQVYF